MIRDRGFTPGMFSLRIALLAACTAATCAAAAPAAATGAGVTSAATSSAAPSWPEATFPVRAQAGFVAYSRLYCLADTGALVAYVAGIVGALVATEVAIYGWYRNRQTARAAAALAAVARRMAEGDAGARSGIPHAPAGVGAVAQAFDDAADALYARELEMRESHDVVQAAYENLRVEAEKQANRFKQAVESLEAEVAMLRESQARYRAVIGQTVDGFFLATVGEKRLLESNKAFRSMLGYRSTEVPELTVYDFAADRALADIALVSGGDGDERQFVQQKYRRKDGTWVDVEVSSSLIVYRGREVVCGVVHDITERKEAERQLYDQNVRLQEAVVSERKALEQLKTAQSHMVQTEKLAALGQMVAGVAHEINNPLAFVNNNIAVLQRDLRGIGMLLDLYRRADPVLEQHATELDAEVKELTERLDVDYTRKNIDELLNRSREGVRRIQQIVLDLRDFARLDETDVKEVDLNTGITTTVHIVMNRAKNKGVEVETDLAPLPQVECYPGKINQVVMNLVANAIDACGQRGRVKVLTRPENGGVRIDVTDNGSGIPPDIRKRIFDPFFTTKAQGEGTGLGLSISYGIVQNHGGTIEVDSTPGQGSRFTVKLPVRMPAQATAE